MMFAVTAIIGVIVGAGIFVVGSDTRSILLLILLLIFG